MKENLELHTWPLPTDRYGNNVGMKGEKVADAAVEGCAVAGNHEEVDLNFLFKEWRHKKLSSQYYI